MLEGDIVVSFAAEVVVLVVEVDIIVSFAAEDVARERDTGLVVEGDVGKLEGGELNSMLGCSCEVV